MNCFWDVGLLVRVNLEQQKVEKWLYGLNWNIGCFDRNLDFGDFGFFGLKPIGLG